MRKRVVAGLVALVVIGVGGYLLSQPKTGTVEYHKREYRAYMALSAQPNHWTDMSIVPLLVRDWQRSRWARQREFHQRALIETGYLKEVKVNVSKSLWLSACIPPDLRLDDLFSDETRAFMTFRRSERDGAVFVIAPTTAAEQIADVVRKAYEGPDR